MNWHHNPRRAPTAAAIIAMAAVLLAVACDSLPIIGTGSPAPCDRSQAMLEALEEATGWDCDEITDDDLADVRSLSVSGPLKQSDFAGLRLQSLSIYGDLEMLGEVPVKFRDNIQVLSLSGSGLTELPPGTFDGLTNLQELYLANNDLTELPPGIFDDLANLQRLELWGNPGDPFNINVGICNRTDGVRSHLQGELRQNCASITDADLASLQSLDWENGALTELPPGSFAGLINLQRLRLYQQASGRIELHPGAFDGLANLQWLHLADNDLTGLPSGAFDGLTNLQRLNLGATNLTELPPGAFDGLVNLQELNLFGNRLTELPPGVFDGLTHLQYLDLRSNDLTELPPGVFDRLTNLQTLNLGLNDPTELPPGVFDNLTNLQALILWGNLTGLSPGVFDGLANLQKLFLWSDLEELPPGVFDGLTHLQYLDLMSNALTELPPGVFDSLANLQTLRLLGNPGEPFTITHPNTYLECEGCRVVPR